MLENACRLHTIRINVNTTIGHDLSILAAGRVPKMDDVFYTLCASRRRFRESDYEKGLHRNLRAGVWDHMPERKFLLRLPGIVRCWTMS